MIPIKKVLALFDASERRAFWRLQAGVVLAALLNVTGIVSVAPFFAIVADPAMIRANHALSRIYDAGGFTDTNRFLIVLGAGIFVLFVFGNLFGLGVMHALMDFSYMKNYAISRRLFRSYLSEPYAFFLHRNGTELAKNIIEEVSQVVNGVVHNVMLFIAQSVAAFAIVAFLVVIDPFVAAIAFVILGGLYGLLYAVVRRKLLRIGSQRVVDDRERFKIIGEAFAGIKDVKIAGCEASFVSEYARHAESFSRNVVAHHSVSLVPRYVMETVLFGGMLAMVLYFLMRHGAATNILPMVALYAFAGYRLMPALQLVFHAATAMRYGQAALDLLCSDLKRLHEEEPAMSDERGVRKLPVTRDIRFDGVSFCYDGAHAASLRDVSFTVPVRTSVGLVGPTGAGKTTLVDIVMALLLPQDGRVLIDGVPLSPENARAWRHNVGYVPQAIHLADDTVLRNIAFGRFDAEIDRQAVIAAAKAADIHGFVSSLPQGYDTVVGERGVRLSGGQRQRIGIARALYGDPEVIVFDEATSALDGVTEDAVMEAVRGFAHKKTIVLIAHRLTTVRECDAVYLMDGGRIVDSGRYEDLLRDNVQFRAMAQAGRG